MPEANGRPAPDVERPAFLAEERLDIFAAAVDLLIAHTL
jgi:hypothetical protein